MSEWRRRQKAKADWVNTSAEPVPSESPQVDSSGGDGAASRRRFLSRGISRWGAPAPPGTSSVASASGLGMSRSGGESDAMDVDMEISDTDSSGDDQGAGAGTIDKAGSAGGDSESASSDDEEEDEDRDDGRDVMVDGDDDSSPDDNAEGEGDSEGEGENEPFEQINLTEVDIEDVARTIEVLRRDELAMKRMMHSLHLDLEEKGRQAAKLRQQTARQSVTAKAKSATGPTGGAAEEQRRVAEERIRGAVAAAAMRAARSNQLQQEAAEVARKLARGAEEGDPAAVAALSPRTATVPAWILYRQLDPARDEAVAAVMRDNREAVSVLANELAEVGVPAPLPTPSGPDSTPLSRPLQTEAGEASVPRAHVVRVVGRRLVARRARLLGLRSAYAAAQAAWNAKVAAREGEEAARQRAAKSAAFGGLGGAALGMAGSPYADGPEGVRSSRRRAAVPEGLEELGGSGAAFAGSGRGGGFGVGGFGDVIRSEWELQQYMAELEEEDRRQRARDATTARLPDMLDPWDIAGRQFDPGANQLWSTDGAASNCATWKPAKRCGGLWGRVVRQPGAIVELQPCNCVVAAEEEHSLINPWSDVEKLIFMDKFMQYPKDFSLIASFLTNKTPQDCVAFYYLSKPAAEYKQKLKAQSMALRRRSARNGWALAVQALESVGAEVPTPIADAINVGDVVPVGPHMPDMQFSRTRLLLRPEKVVSAGKPSKGKIKRGGARWALVPDDLGMGGLEAGFGSSSRGLGGGSSATDSAMKRSRAEDSSMEMSRLLAPQFVAKWSHSEKEAFLKLFKVHGRDWKAIADLIPTKTCAQVKNYFQNNKRQLNLVDPF